MQQGDNAANLKTYYENGHNLVQRTRIKGYQSWWKDDSKSYTQEWKRINKGFGLIFIQKITPMLKSKGVQVLGWT